MTRLSTPRLAQVAITTQFLAPLRTAAEFLRHRSVQGPALTMEVAALRGEDPMQDDRRPLVPQP